MKYLVTGVNGQLGYDVVKELKNNGITDILETDTYNMDITDKKVVDKIITEYKPDVIFHCAAYTAVDASEDEGKEISYQVNVEGTKNITEASKKVNAKLIYISTDYVFDGTKDGLYTETDIPNPKSVYGTTKHLGELEAKKNDQHFIVRISWVFGINGNNFVKTMLRLAETRNELNVVNDQIGSPTYTVDLAKALIELTKTDSYGTYHITNEGFCSWAEFAEYIYPSNGISMIVNKITSEEYPQKAYRPKNSCMDKSKINSLGITMPTWQDAIDRYNIELKEILK